MSSAEKPGGLPPRVAVDVFEFNGALLTELAGESPEGVVYEYLSLEEHAAILESERRLARAEAFEYVALQFDRAAELSEEVMDAKVNRLNATWLRGKAKAARAQSGSGGK
jgi:hypothetical protein